MTAHASSHDPFPGAGELDADRAAEAAGDDDRSAEQGAGDEWAILVRPRHSRREYLRQIVVDVAVVLVVLVVIALLS